MKIEQVLIYGRRALAEKFPSANLDSEIILCFILKKTREYLFSHNDAEISDFELKNFESSIQERLLGKPVAYITREKEFYGRTFYVDDCVLIPRPETELLIDCIKKWNCIPRKILDIGTGSGCIAITLKKEFPNAEVVATDVSSAALDVAQKNSRIHGVDVEFICGDLFNALEFKKKAVFDCIISNPPYLPLDILDNPSAETIGLHYEPQLALIPNYSIDDGANNTISNADISVIEKIISQAALWLAKKSILLIEIGYNQGEQTRAIAKACFPNAKVNIHRDYSENDRVISIKQE